jgi:chemotaxis protein CheD
MNHAGQPMDVFLQPGEYFVGGADCRIRTLLGSCVSITLWHPASRIGGMSHFLLATRGNRGGAELDGRYGDEALRLMLRDLERAGVDSAQCEAKIFGGGNMFPGISRAAAIGVGQYNGEAAREMLQVRGIPIISHCLYGVGHRQVIFDISTGDVWSRQVKPVEMNRENAGETA